MFKLATVFVGVMLAGDVAATVMDVTLAGTISGKSAQLAAPTDVRVGDAFSLRFQYDDAEATTSQVSVNGGMVYTLVNNTFSPALTAVSGSLGAEILQFNSGAENGGVAGWGGGTFWYRPVGVLDHREWSLSSGAFSNTPNQRGFSLQIVTDFQGAPGYGWFSIGSAVGDAVTGSTIDYGFLSLTSITISPVPEPAPWQLLAAGAVLSACWRLRRVDQRSRRHRS